jgi:RHS repeat-associated protein
LPFSYKGYYRLPGTDMMWTHARFYDAGLRQFMSHDPLGGDLLNPVTLNSTSAFDGDPIGKVDVLGLRDEEVYAQTTYINLPGTTITGTRSPVIPIAGPGPAVLVQPEEAGDGATPADDSGEPFPDGIPDQPSAGDGPDGFFLEADTEEGADVAATAAEISSTNARAMLAHHAEASARFDATASGYRGVDPWSLPVSALMLPRWRRVQDRWGIRQGVAVAAHYSGARPTPGTPFAPGRRSARSRPAGRHTPAPIEPGPLNPETPGAPEARVTVAQYTPPSPREIIKKQEQVGREVEKAIEMFLECQFGECCYGSCECVGEHCPKIGVPPPPGRGLKEIGKQVRKKLVKETVLGQPTPWQRFVRWVRSLFASTPKGEKILWESWQNYPKVTRGGRTYARVGDRLYTRHAVDRLQPSGLGAPPGQVGPGRSISPTFVEDVIRTGQKTTVTVDGVERTIHTSGSVKVVTEGDIVITVNPWGSP